MRKLLLIATIAMLPLIGASAQDWSFGIKAGANYADDNAKYTSAGISLGTAGQTSFYVAGLAEYKIAPQWGIQGELMYARNGGSGFSNTLPMGYAPYSLKDGNLTVQTISLPFMVKRYFWGEKFSIGLGMTFGYASSEKFRYDNINDAQGNNLTISVPSDDMDFGFIGGLEYKITKNFFVDARYVYGMTNTAKDSKSALLNGESLCYKTRAVQFGIGYRF